MSVNAVVSLCRCTQWLSLNNNFIVGGFTDAYMYIFYLHINRTRCIQKGLQRCTYIHTQYIHTNVCYTIKLM